MNIQKQNKNKSKVEISAAVGAHQHAVRKLLQDAVKAGFLTEQELERCVEHADGSRWDLKDHSRRGRPDAVNVDVVWSTYDYNAFSLLDQGLNRGVDHWMSIVKSMARCPMMDPCIVNENFQIIDGQNRFFARRYLGLPIEYIIRPGYDVVHARNYNTTSKNWSKTDFVTSYCAEGLENYVKLEQLYLKYPMIPKAVIDQVVTRGTSGSNANTVIQQGSLEIGSVEDCEMVCDYLMDYAKFPNYLTPSQMIISSSKFCRAWLTLYVKNKQFDPKRLLKNAYSSPSYIYPSANVKETCAMLVKLYNRNCKAVNLVY